MSEDNYSLTYLINLLAYCNWLCLIKQWICWNSNVFCMLVVIMSLIECIQFVYMCMCILLLLCHLIYWTEAQLTCSVNTFTPLALSQWLCNVLCTLSEFIPWKYSQRRGNSSRKLTIMQSTPPYSAALYLHYLLWDLPGECSPPACLHLIHVVEGAAWVCSSHVSYLHFNYIVPYVISVVSRWRWETRCNVCPQF